MLCLLLIFVSTTQSTPTDQELLTMFNSYLTEYKRSYSSTEFDKRFQNFKVNYFLIQESNSKHPGFFLKIGPNSDKSPEDFTQLTTPSNSSEFAILKDSQVPDSIDWVKQGKVSKIKSLSTCSASWAFAAIDTIESILAITKNVPAFQLSTQQIVSCSDSYGNSGCTSGNLNNSYTYAENSVLCTELQYPYTAKFSSCKKKFFCQNRISGFSMLQSLNETLLKMAVAQQPVAVTLNVTKEVLNYAGGILSLAGCGNAVQQGNFVVVGYGSVAGKDVWVVRGYWGEKWGIGGYAMVERNDKNDKTPGACGIALESYIPTFSG